MQQSGPRDPLVKITGSVPILIGDSVGEHPREEVCQICKRPLRAAIDPLPRLNNRRQRVAISAREGLNKCLVHFTQRAKAGDHELHGGSARTTNGSAASTSCSPFVDGLPTNNNGRRAPTSSVARSVVASISGSRSWKLPWTPRRLEITSEPDATACRTESRCSAPHPPPIAAGSSSVASSVRACTLPCAPSTDVNRSRSTPGGTRAIFRRRIQLIRARAGGARCGSSQRESVPPLQAQLRHRGCSGGPPPSCIPSPTRESSQRTARQPPAGPAAAIRAPSPRG